IVVDAAMPHPFYAPTITGNGAVNSAAGAGKILAVGGYEWFGPAAGWRQSGRTVSWHTAASAGLRAGITVLSSPALPPSALDGSPMSAVSSRMCSRRRGRELEKRSADSPCHLFDWRRQ